MSIALKEIHHHHIRLKLDTIFFFKFSALVAQFFVSRFLFLNFPSSLNLASRVFVFYIKLNFAGKVKTIKTGVHLSISDVHVTLYYSNQQIRKGQMFLIAYGCSFVHNFPFLVVDFFRFFVAQKQHNGAKQENSSAPS